MAGVLSDIKVLDLTRIVAGPWCTQMLADLGATVLKIERPVCGDDTRRMGPFLKDADGTDTQESALYLACNRGKQSVAVDFTSDAGAALIRKLAVHCDVFIENFKTGGLARYGLDEASIRKLRPDIIYVSVSGFGSDGPYSGRAAYDFVMQGRSGLMSTCGFADGPPVRTGIPMTDLFTGYTATVAVLAALRHRDKTGEGQFIDCAMLDASVAVNGHLAMRYLLLGQVPGREGNSNPLAAPADVYACSDGDVIVTAGNDGQFVAIARVLGVEHWLNDPRFATNPARVRHRHALNAALAEQIGRWTSAELLQRLDAAGVPCGPINTMPNVFADPQVQHRQLAMTVPHALGGEVPTLRSPLRLSKTPVEHGSPPLLGQHTDPVLQQIAGLDVADIQALKHLGVIG